MSSDKFPLPLILAGAYLFLSSGGDSKPYSGNDKPKIDDNPAPPAPPAPVPQGPVKIDLGDWVAVESDDLATLGKTYYSAPAAEYAASTGPGGVLARWAAVGVSAALQLLDGKHVSRFPDGWGGGEAPPPEWSRLDWASVLSVRDLVVRLAAGEPVPGPPVPTIQVGGIGAVAAPALIAGLASKTPEQLREYGQTKPPPNSSYVAMPLDALAHTLVAGARNFYAEAIEP